MARVLILGKTKMGDGICLGGFDVDRKRSLRLTPPDRFSHPLDTPHELGDLWEMDLKALPPSMLNAPHKEDIEALNRRCVQKATPDKVKAFIVSNMDAPQVQPKDLFDGRLQINRNGKACITPERGIPLYSTGHWRFDKALSRQVDGGRFGKRRTRYVLGDGSLDVPFVGFQEAPQVIPAGAVLRFSLTRWFNDNPGFWLQLSGWWL